MQLLGISSLAFVVLQGSVHAVQNAITCTTTADCAWGETCVAGDADTVVQACVAPSVCGGSSMGNCPSDDSGKLACLWRPYNDCSEGCAILNGNKGIYKCVSISRCDAYYGGASCSDGCSVNGVRCNGQGSCNMMSTNADGTPVFGCTCENGYSGSMCETKPGTTKSKNSTSTKDDEDNSSASKDRKGTSSSTKDNKSTSSSTKDKDTKDNGWGALGEDFWGALDKQNSKNSKNSTTDGSDDNTQDTADTDDSSTDKSVDSSTDASDASDESASDNADDSTSSSTSASGSGAVASSESESTTTRSGIRPGVLILILVMTAFFLIGTVLLVAYSRRRKRQEEEEYNNALASTHGIGVVGERDLAAGHTGRTPRAHIQTM